MAPPLPRLEGVTNFRELGGLPTRDGRRVRERVLFRSGHWGAATDGDREHMAKLGIRVVLDFRTDRDIELEGHDRLADAVEHVQLPTGDPAAANDIRSLLQSGEREVLHEHFGNGGAERYMRNGAAGMVTERSDSFAGFLRHLAEPGCPPALFHCSAGKDRAGWAASCVLLALGVDEELVIEHYLESNRTFDVNHQRGAGWVEEPELIALLEPLVKVKPEYARASIDAAVERHGSLDGYFRDALGLDDARREQLRRNWLEG